MTTRSTLFLIVSQLCFCTAFGQDSTYSFYDFARMNTPQDAINIVETNLQKSVGKQAPPMEFHTVSDQVRHNLSEFSGGVVMLNFWARGCAPCIKEMPDMSILQDDYRRVGLSVLFLANGDCEDEKRFFDIHETSGLKCCVDARRLLKPYQAGVIPMTILIDRNGIIQDGWFGAIGYEAMEKRINTLIPRDQKRFLANISRFVSRLPIPPLYAYLVAGGVFLIIIGLASTFMRRLGKSANAA